MSRPRIFVGVEPFRPADVSVFESNSEGELAARRLTQAFRLLGQDPMLLESTGTVSDAAAMFRSARRAVA